MRHRRWGWWVGLVLALRAAAEPTCPGAFWEGHVAYGHPLVIAPIGMTKVDEFGFSCLEVIVERDKAICGNFELQLVNGLNDLYDLSSHIGQTVNASFGVREGSAAKTEWRLVFTNTNNGCKYQQVAISVSLTVDPVHRICPAPNGTDCSGHGLCNLSPGKNQCVCQPHWKCVGLPCTCEQCERGWKGPRCDIPSGFHHAYIGVLVLYASAIVFLGAIGAHLYRTRRGGRPPEQASLLSTKDSLALFQVDTSKQAPHLQTKLYF